MLQTRCKNIEKPKKKAHTTLGPHLEWGTLSARIVGLSVKCPAQQPDVGSATHCILVLSLNGVAVTLTFDPICGISVQGESESILQVRLPSYWLIPGS